MGVGSSGMVKSFLIGTRKPWADSAVLYAVVASTPAALQHTSAIFSHVL